MPDELRSSQRTVVFKTSWGETDFVDVADLRKAIGYYAATKKAMLTLSNVALNGPGSEDIQKVSFELLRTEDECSEIAEVNGSCTVIMPAGVERPPFIRVSAADDRLEFLGDLRLPKPEQGAMKSAMLMNGGGKTISFEYAIEEMEHDPNEPDWNLIWSCLPAGWDADGRLDHMEMEQWLTKMREVLPAEAFPTAAESLEAKLAHCVIRGSDLAASSTKADSNDTTCALSTRLPSLTHVHVHATRRPRSMG